MFTRETSVRRKRWYLAQAAVRLVRYWKIGSSAVHTRRAASDMGGVPHPNRWTAEESRPNMQRTMSRRLSANGPYSNAVLLFFLDLLFSEQSQGKYSCRTILQRLQRFDELR